MDSPIYMHTLSALKSDFKKVGIKPGMTVLVHSSLKSVGHVCGGPVTIILALEELLTETGTLVMPTFNTNLTDPAQWTSPPVEKCQLQEILDEMPPFDLDLTPTRQMGCVSETFRKQVGVIRSPHPHLSFAAWGKHAKSICANHSLEFALGEKSPLARIYELRGHVLLLGVDHDRNTSMHLAEYSSRVTKTHVVQKAPLVIDGAKQWVEFDEIDLDNSDFLKIGRDFENQTGEVNCGTVGDTQVKLMSQPLLVDFAKNAMCQQVLPKNQRS